MAAMVCLSFATYFLTAFCVTLLFGRSVRTALIAGVVFPGILYLLLLLGDAVTPAGTGGFMRLNAQSLWLLPGAFLKPRETPSPVESELDWSRQVAGGRTLASWNLSNSHRRAVGWVNGTQREEIFRYNDESLGAWGSEFHDGIPDGRGGYFIAGLFLMTGHGGENFPMLHFSGKGALDRSFPYRSSTAMEAGDGLLIASDGSLWLRVNAAPKYKLQHWTSDWKWDGEYGEPFDLPEEVRALLQ